MLAIWGGGPRLPEVRLLRVQGGLGRPRLREPFGAGLDAAEREQVEAPDEAGRVVGERPRDALGDRVRAPLASRRELHEAARLLAEHLEGRPDAARDRVLDQRRR